MREAAHYRRDAFMAGLQRLGYRVQPGLPTAPIRDDLLLSWNRQAGAHDRTATLFESRGLPVLIAENGYLGVKHNGTRTYALARSHHNGAGRWPTGGPERWAALGVELLPWRRPGGETVILPQRGVGAPGVAMPQKWPREFHGFGRTRKHPGTKEQIPLEVDLARASQVITWGSGAAIKALVLGIPVFYSFPKWIGAPAARPVGDIKLGAKCDDEARLRMFERLAWAQWTIDEIASGEAIKRVLES